LRKLLKRETMKTKLEITVEVEIDFTYCRGFPAFRDCPQVEEYAVCNGVSFKQNLNDYITQNYQKEMLELAYEEEHGRKENE